MASPSPTPVIISSEFLQTIPYSALIDHFQDTLPSLLQKIKCPLRHAHSLSPSSTLLLMPAWNTSPGLPFAGVKLVTIFDHNSALNLPTVQATYNLFSSATGLPIASIDGTHLTLLRTACLSALASKFLSNETSKVLVMVGAGALAPHLIKAHISARPSLEKVIIWNRSPDKAASLAEQIDGYRGVVALNCTDLAGVMPAGDIVCCATSSEVPLVMGKLLKTGAHLNLVGSFKETMTECDDEAVRRGLLVVDGAAALEEAGEVVGALKRGVIREDEVRFLTEVVAGGGGSAGSVKDVTVFKSVGSAAADLLAAQLVYDIYTKKE